MSANHKKYCGEFDNYGAVMSVSTELLCSFELLKPLDSSALKSQMKKARLKRNSMLNSPPVSNPYTPPLYRCTRSHLFIACRFCPSKCITYMCFGLFETVNTRLSLVAAWYYDGLICWNKDSNLVVLGDSESRSDQG